MANVFTWSIIDIIYTVLFNIFGWNSASKSGNSESLVKKKQIQSDNAKCGYLNAW